MTSPNANLTPRQCICGKCDCGIPFGFCHCGCEGKTAISRKQRPDRNLRKGEPQMFIFGHMKYGIRRHADSLDRFKIDGVYCRLIPLTRGQYAIVCDEDFADVNRFKWYAHRSEGTRSFYAAMRDKNGKCVLMHRYLLGDPCGQVDHRNQWNTLDNRRANLRVATNQQNAANRRLSKRNKTGFKGVHLDPSSGKYMAHIGVGGKSFYLGQRNTPEAASLLYMEAACKNFGDYASDGK